MALDFSNITDDQLLQLIQEVMTEAVKRGSAIAYAAHEVYFDAQTELRIKAQAAEKAAQAAAAQKIKDLQQQAEAEVNRKTLDEAAEKQARIWSKKAAIVTALLEDELFQEDKEKGFQINIWQGANDVRVYLQEGPRNGWEIVYYRTGNSYHPPGSVTGVNSGDEDRIARFCEQLCKKWTPGLRLGTKDVPSRIVPHEKDLADYRSALKAEETSNV